MDLRVPSVFQSASGDPAHASPSDCMSTVVSQHVLTLAYCNIRLPGANKLQPIHRVNVRRRHRRARARPHARRNASHTGGAPVVGAPRAAPTAVTPPVTTPLVRTARVGKPAGGWRARRQRRRNVVPGCPLRSLHVTPCADQGCLSV